MLLECVWPGQLLWLPCRPDHNIWPEILANGITGLCSIVGQAKPTTNRKTRQRAMLKPASQPCSIASGIIAIRLTSGEPL